MRRAATSSKAYSSLEQSLRSVRYPNSAGGVGTQIDELLEKYSIQSARLSNNALKANVCTIQRFSQAETAERKVTYTVLSHASLLNNCLAFFRLPNVKPQRAQTGFLQSSQNDLFEHTIERRIAVLQGSRKLRS